MQVQTGTGAFGERLGHERRDHAALGREGGEQVAQGDDAVGGGQGVRVGEVLLELSVAVLVVVGVVAPTELIHRRRHGGEMVVHTGEPADVVAGPVGIVGRVGGDERAVGVSLEQEVLDLRADPRFEPGVGGLRDQRLEDVPRGERPRLALDVGIAVDDRQALLDEGNRQERRDVGDGDEVGVLGLLPDRADRVAGETDSVVGQFVDGFDRYEFRARLATQVDEHGEDELGVVDLAEFREGLGVSHGLLRGVRGSESSMSTRMILCLVLVDARFIAVPLSAREVVVSAASAARSAAGGARSTAGGARSAAADARSTAGGAQSAAGDAQSAA